MFLFINGLSLLFSPNFANDDDDDDDDYYYNHGRVKFKKKNKTKTKCGNIVDYACCPLGGRR